MGTFLFQGPAALVLDAKGRMAVPTRHREALLAACQGEVTITKHPVGCLRLYPRPVWEQFRERLMALPMKADGLKRIFLGNAQDATMDATGRLLIAPELRAGAGLVRDVMLLGLGEHLEIWDAQRHAAYEAEQSLLPLPEDLGELPI